jgi:hypothetical protein
MAAIGYATGEETKEFRPNHRNAIDTAVNHGKTPMVRTFPVLNSIHKDDAFGIVGT